MVPGFGGFESEKDSGDGALVGKLPVANFSNYPLLEKRSGCCTGCVKRRYSRSAGHARGVLKQLCRPGIDGIGDVFQARIIWWMWKIRWQELNNGFLRQINN